MFILLSPKDLRNWQLWHYAKRLKEERRPEARQFLANQLRNLKRKK